MVACLIGLSTLASAQPISSFAVPEDYLPGLKPLLESALRQSPRMIARNAEEVIAEADRIAARAGQLPTIGGYASYHPYARERRWDPNGLTSNVGNNEKIAYNFSLSQPVFHWGALRDTTRMAELRLKIAEGNTAEAYRILLDHVRNHYLQLVVLKASVARARFNQQIADDALAIARSKRQQNVISEADLFTPTVTAEQARLRVDQTEFNYEISKTSLAKLCGVEVVSDAAVADAIPAVTPDSASVERLVDEFLGRGEPDTFYLQNLRRGIEIEKLTHDIHNTRLKPKISASVGVSQDEQTFSYASASTNKYKIQTTYAGVMVNWTIFDSFSTRSAKIASLARRRELERIYKAEAGDLLMSVQTQKRQLEFAARGLAISEKFLASAEDGVRVAEDNLRRGLSSEAAVSDARLLLQTRQLETFAARNDYLMKLSQLLSTTLNDPALNLLPAKYR